jgi:hypothetical protein
MKRQIEFGSIVTIVIALIVLLFGDNIYEQIYGQSFFSKFSKNETPTKEIISTVTPFSTVFIAPTTTPTFPQPSSAIIDLNCHNKEKMASINGSFVQSSSWQSDCSYNQVLNGESITLTTWGIVLTYSPSLSSAKVIEPYTYYITPLNSVLFAGYSNKESAIKAYQIRNPNAPTPIP